MLALHTPRKAPPLLACREFGYDPASDSLQYGWYQTGSANEGARRAAPGLAAAAVTWGMSGAASSIAGAVNSSAGLAANAALGVGVGNATVAIAANAVQQGVAVSLGQQEDFDWRSTVAAGVTAYLGTQWGSPDFSTGATWGKFGEAFGRNVALGTVSSVISGDSFSSGSTFRNIALSAASSTASQWASGQSQQAQRAQQAEQQQIARSGMDHEYGIYGQQDGWARESALMRQEDMRDAEMTRLMRLPESVPTQGIGPWSAGDYKNQSDLQSDNYSGGRRTITIEPNKGLLGSMASQGYSTAQQRALMGQLERYGQLGGLSPGGLQAGQQFYADLDDLRSTDGRRGGVLISGETAQRVAAANARDNASELQRLASRPVMQGGQGNVPAGAMSGVDLIPRGGYGTSTIAPVPEFSASRALNELWRDFKGGATNLAYTMSGARAADQATASFKQGHYGDAAIYGLTSFMEAGLTVFTLPVSGMRATTVTAQTAQELAAVRSTSSATGANSQLLNSQRGSTGTVFSGHGSYEIGSGIAVVPEGTSLTVYSKFGSTITDRLGNIIETGGDLSNVYRRTYSAGEKLPNYTLHAPNGLSIQGNPFTVNSPTPLTDLLMPGMGNCSWAACTYNWRATNSNLVFDTVGIANKQSKQWITIYSNTTP
ncbi:MAG: hypothetical protein HEQ39_05515 [Rhizobacter sp.]